MPPISMYTRLTYKPKRESVGYQGPARGAAGARPAPQPAAPRAPSGPGPAGPAGGAAAARDRSNRRERPNELQPFTPFPRPNRYGGRLNPMVAYQGAFGGQPGPARPGGPEPLASGRFGPLGRPAAYLGMGGVPAGQPTNRLSYQGPPANPPTGQGERLASETATRLEPYTGEVYATSRYGEVFGPSADMPLSARFKWYVDHGQPIPPYLETAGLSQPEGPGTAVYFNDGSYVRWDDPTVGGPGYGAPDNPETWLRQMRAEAAARRATYPARGAAVEEERPALGGTELGSF